jgi:hypothetical protein
VITAKNKQLQPTMKGVIREKKKCLPKKMRRALWSGPLENNPSSCYVGVVVVVVFFSDGKKKEH